MPVEGLGNKLRHEINQFFLENARKLTENWYKDLDKEVYSVTEDESIEKLKQQNYNFHTHFCEIFVEDELNFYKLFEKWLMNVSRSEGPFSKPIPSIMRDFFRTQEQYLDLFERFTELTEGLYDQKELSKWRRRIIQAFEKLVIWFIDENHFVSTEKLTSQHDTITELSCPVIQVGGNIALLPLVGDIDTARSMIITENTLKDCDQNRIVKLYIDLSGVFIIDTMVAQKIFDLIEALDLIGVESILSGFRPELAQTAVQLGIDFSNVKITSKLQLIKN